MSLLAPFCVQIIHPVQQKPLRILLWSLNLLHLIPNLVFVSVEPFPQRILCQDMICFLTSWRWPFLRGFSWVSYWQNPFLVMATLIIYLTGSRVLENTDFWNMEGKYEFLDWVSWGGKPLSECEHTTSWAEVLDSPWELVKHHFLCSSSLGCCDKAFPLPTTMSSLPSGT